MTIQRYTELHDALIELAHEWVKETGKRLSEITVADLMQWSALKTQEDKGSDTK